MSKKNFPIKNQTTKNYVLRTSMASVSSAFLASCFAWFATQAAVAASLTLIDDDSNGRYEKVENLLFENVLYDVTFKTGSINSVYGDGKGGFSFDFSNLVDAEGALRALDAAVSSIDDDYAFESPNFDEIDRFPGAYYIHTNENGIEGGVSQSGYVLFRGGIFESFWSPTGPGFDGEVFGMHALFELSEMEEITPASTPEPSVVLGFITLGGLMLGSKRKTKG